MVLPQGPLTGPVTSAHSQAHRETAVDHRFAFAVIRRGPDVPFAYGRPLKARFSGFIRQPTEKQLEDHQGPGNGAKSRPLTTDR